MKFVLTLVTIVTLICTGCASRPPKTCYEMTVTFNGTSKQVICTNQPQHESQYMLRVK